MIVLDANILVALFDPDHPRHKTAERLLESCAGEPKVISVLTMAEFLVHAAMQGTAEVAARNVAKIKVEVRSGAAEDAAALAMIRAHRHIKMPDAVVLHLARAVNGTVMTFDQDLGRAAKGTGLKVLGIE